MKWLLWAAAITAALWAGSGWLEGGIERGRQATATVVADPVYGLAATMDQTRDAVGQANRRIDVGGEQAMGALGGANSSASAYAGAVRRDLQGAARR